MLEVQEFPLVIDRSLVANMATWLNQPRRVVLAWEKRWRWLLLLALFLRVDAVTVGDQQAGASATTVDWKLLFIGPEKVVSMMVTVQADEGPLLRRQKLANMLLQRFDSDKDDQLSATEAAQLPAGAKISGTPLGEAWKPLDVAPVDDQLSAEELFLYVESQLGPAFQRSIRPTRLTANVRLLERMDQDQDLAISPDELRHGLPNLLTSDLDDDESISVGELQPYPRRPGLIRPTTSESTQSPILPVSTTEEIHRAVERILATYGKTLDGTAVDVSRIEAPDGKHTEYDVNQDGRFDAKELTTWIESGLPAVSILATLRQRKPSTVETRMGPSRQSGSKVSLLLGGATVDITAINNKSEQTDTAKLYRVRFLTSDRDKNGYLNEMEYSGLQLPAAYADVDANHDGMLLRDELTPYVEYDAIAVQARIEMMVSEEGKTLFELLDANTDRRLTVREVRDGFSNMSAIDRNADQRIAQTELESRFRLTFSFGRNPSFLPITGNQNMLLTPRLRSSDRGPIWYRRMDRNLDGDLTWREFLGSREVFDRIDRNADQLIDADEAASVMPEQTTQP